MIGTYEGVESSRYGGLYQLNRTADDLNPITLGATASGVKMGPVMAIHEDREKSLWLGTKQTGLFRLNRKTGEVLQILTESDDPTTSPTHGNITTIFESISNPGELWIGTEGGGLNHFDKKTKKYTRYTGNGENNNLNTAHITSIFEDKSGRLLIGTLKSGFFVIHGERNNSTQFTTYNSSLPDDHVSCILCDSEGYIWLGMSSGLTRYDPESDLFYTYDERHGPIAQPYIASCARDDDGRLIFGGIDGFTVFQPEKITAKILPPRVVLTKLLVESQPPAHNPNGSSPIWITEKVSLTHRQNTFSFEFAALDYNAPESNQYLYKLEGHDLTWQAATSGPRASYSRVKYGDYVFRVVAANSRGVWNREGVTLHVTILPPWWKTWWAYFGYMLLASGGVYAVYNFQLKQRLQQAEALRLNELEAFKNKMYTNISHEFRAPLTVILGMAHQVLESPKENYRRGMTMILRNGKNLLVLVNQILDLSKLESSKLALQYRRGDVVVFLEYIIEGFKVIANSKGVHLHFISFTEQFILDFDEPRLQQVVSNLLDNAIKFTPKGGDVYVTVNKVDNRLILNIQDTGLGIDETDLPHIFDRFYQANGTHTRGGEGTGIGLALTRELVKLMKGSIVAKSKKGMGSEFEVTLPVPLVSDLTAQTKEKDRWPIPFQKRPPVHIEDSFSSPSSVPGDSGDLPVVQHPTVLIADDNSDVRVYLASCLKNIYTLEIAKDGKECEDMAFTMTPDLIIMDVMMPFKDGFQVCETLKSDERTSHIPIIMLTVKTDLDSKLEGFAHGADEYLTKPFNKKELLMRIGNLLELRLKLQRHYRFLLQSGVSGNQKNPMLNAESTALKDARAGKQNIPSANSLEHAFVSKIKKVVEAHIDDPEFDVEKLCRSVALSHSQVHRKLSALTGLSATHFIRYVRLVKAKEMIIHSGYSIAAIAFDCGFNDPAYFSRIFKQEFGVTPHGWREQNSL